jgi:hypothetical protein
VENGKKVNFMGKVLPYGRMEENIQEPISRIESMGRANSSGEMEGSIRGLGFKAASMESESLLI